MSAQYPDPGTSIATASTYRVRADGRVSESWSDRFAGMSITTTDEVTTLTGILQDQSELMGVLNTLHLLRLTVTSVERIDEEGAER